MPDPIRFLLNGAPVELAGVPPQTTLLEYLREHRGLTGTKEGCAEGDCGACTVALAERTTEGLSWRPLNSCIRLLPSIDGAAVYTAESLRAADGTLHPVQQALVDAHASQCGFCTPGFVMSLFAVYKSQAAPTREQACVALSGNLCRCTGYRPILAAAQSMHALPAPADWRAPGDASAAHGVSAADAPIARALAALARDAPLDYAADGARWIAPRTLQGVIDACAALPGAQLVAGATDVGLWVTKEHRLLGDVIYLGAVAELRHLARTGDGWHIGAAVSLDDAFAALDSEFPELHEAWLRFASPPIRSTATLGGNVANGSPIGDSMPALMALRTRVQLASAAGTRSLALEDFYLDYRRTARAPDEVVVALAVPPRAPGLLLRAYKISKRYDQDISAVFACFALGLARGRVTSARIGCGGVAPVPARARRTEAVLVHGEWSAALAERAAATLTDEFAPLTDFRATAAYRRTALGNLLRRLWHEADPDAVAPARVEAVAAEPR